MFSDELHLGRLSEDAATVLAPFLASSSTLSTFTLFRGENLADLKDVQQALDHRIRALLFHKLTHRASCARSSRAES